jgi:hypothetical protein
VACYLVLTPIVGGPSVMTARETTQNSFEALDDWARGISPVYLAQLAAEKRSETERALTQVRAEAAEADATQRPRSSRRGCPRVDSTRPAARATIRLRGSLP